MNRRHALALVIWLQLLSAGAGTAAGQAPPSFDPVEAGSRSLRRLSFPWYDPNAADATPVRVAPSRDSLRNRSSTWVQSPRPPQTRRPWNWGNLRGGFSAVLRAIGWFIVAAMLAVLVFLLGWALMQRDRARGRKLIQPETVRSGQAAQPLQIENLPFPLEPAQLDLLNEARQQMAAGNFDKAIVLLFSYQLVQLDHRQLVQLAQGKTNRQYLRELRTHPLLRGMLEHTMIRFEDVFFGGRSLNHDQFTDCWRRLDQFHQHLEQSVS